MKKIITACIVVLAGFMLIHNAPTVIQSSPAVETTASALAPMPTPAPVTIETPNPLAVPEPAAVTKTDPAPNPVATPAPASSPAPGPAAKSSPAQTPGRQVAPASVSANKQTEMLNYINAERAKNNAAPLVLDSTLSNGAYLKSKDMADNGYFSHNSPTYGDAFDMMKSLGISYRTAAENIARNRSVLAAYNAFMNSTGHRNNILNPDFHRIGLGFYQDGRDLFVTQWFTN